MNAEWTIVALTVDDYEAVRELWEQAGLPIKANGRDSREQFAGQLAGGFQKVLGVRLGDRLAGVVVATHDGRKGWINRLAVHPEFRRQGLGFRLIAEAERALHGQGLQVIAALIEDWNTPSLALFERAGFVEYPGIHYVTKRDRRDV
ncbi:MAG TPA: GNAT family N-acetyltransferase [Aggregatilineaceae bacterium]|jgi:ribosomal protein S18 acetylase RimI-like enzyme|nr:GNAT family N-acetyltransferase [Aggregatilineaceae bacterium]